ncbi:unnamed protein product [Gadus morhua 'NCC']
MQVIKQQLYGRGVSCVEPQTPRGIEPGFFWISEPNGPSGHSASARRLVFHALSTPAPFVPGRTRLYTSATEPLSKWPGPDLLENDKYLFI